ncbi:hypothetical protein SCHPADRAFT_833572 [Schizopora paradoxa]|uniref:COQ9 C-terminal domain-containing protein n=1 Tax=Schizopora paradoxa TaxID=27342 RepID=A0A0H2RJV8_9AGAM|nr:hypothetical protein SCHPADRAFT_833572 [Schizopora paradoxa]
MSSASTNLTAQILRHALPLVKSHGFTRQALASAVLSLPGHSEPLSDTAVNSLFGSGDAARTTLIKYWLEEGLEEMGGKKGSSINSILKHRLQWNEPVLPYLPEAFAVLSTPIPGPPVDPRPAFWHAATIADEAAYLSGEENNGTDWYARRASLGAIYLAAELHQLSSPSTAGGFLDSLLHDLKGVEDALSNTAQFSQFIGRSWIGIIRSLGLT